MRKQGRATKSKGVQALGGGLYRVRAPYLDPKTGRRTELDREVQAESVSDAARIREELRAAAIAERTPKRETRRRLADVATSWAAARRESLKPSTRATYGDALDRWIDELGDFFLDAIEPDDVRRALAKWSAEQLSPSTVNLRLRVLRTMAREERASQIVEGVRALPQTVGDAETAEDEGRGLEPDELRALLAVGAQEFEAAGVLDRRGRFPHRHVGAWWPLISTLLWTGMRFGEGSALRWDDLDEAEGVLRIRRAQWRGILGHPKSKVGRRDVVTPEPLALVLKEHRQRLVRAQHPRIADGFMFPSVGSESGLVNNTGLRFALQTMLVTAKVARELEDGTIDLDGRPVIHSLRHSLNNLLRQVASEFVRQSLIGHADAAIGERYSKANLDEKRVAMGAVVRLVRGA
jgi:integrase